MLELPKLSTLSPEQKDALILSLFERIRLLEERLSKDSHNSSKPPSSDGLQRRPKSLRKAGVTGPGGQKGHLGSTLKRSQTSDRVITHALPAVCDACGTSLDHRNASVVPETRQVIDLPAIRFEVTEHRVLEVQCTCGKAHRSAFPEYVRQAVQYGPAIKATAVYLTQYQQLPVERSAQALHDLFGVKLSAGTVQSSIAQAGRILAPAVGQIARMIQAAPVVHFDETGLRVGRGLHWLHSASTATLTWYGLHRQRGQAGMEALGILPQFRGVAVHDGWASYRNYPCQHALCNAHHLRELIFVSESTGQAWAQKLISLLCQAKAEVDAARTAGGMLELTRIAHYRKQYEALIAQGQHLNPARPRCADRQEKRGGIKQSFTHNLLVRLHRYADDVLRFTVNPSVPFDNNQAERDIRMPKLKQKVSGCFRTCHGAEAFSIIRSYLATLRKQNRNLMHDLTLAFSGKTVGAA